MRSIWTFVNLWTSAYSFHVGAPPSSIIINACATGCDSRCWWDTVAERMTKRLMHSYFNVDANTSQSCEVFLIEGVPAAAMLYTENNTHGVPIVDSFHLNRALLVLFDGGSHMRKQLYDRYKHITVRKAENRDDFLIIC